jgi:Transposase DDE domain
VLRTLAKNTAQQLQDGIPQAWKWNGRNVFIADGSHVSMPDTPQNQKAYPQPVVQQEGIGFPLARLAVLLSLATGACHDLALAPYAGKGTGETTLLRQMYGSLQPGDVVVADALFDNYFIAWELRQRDIELVARVQAERVGSQTVQSRPDGDIIVWHRPNKPRGMSGEQYRSYPESLTMRQVSVDARDKNNRAEQFKVVTTILDASIEGGQISNLYERRWDGEVDIRSIKSTMKMDILRCKSPEMVEKEIWTHLLAYNLLRTVMAVAAAENKVEPRKISFKGAKQALRAFAPKLEAARPQQRVGLVEAMLKAVGYHRVGGRPGRWEPRARKRRPKPTKRLNQPRHVAKLEHNRVKWY